MTITVSNNLLVVLQSFSHELNDVLGKKTQKKPHILCTYLLSLKLGNSI